MLVCAGCCALRASLVDRVIYKQGRQPAGTNHTFAVAEHTAQTMGKGFNLLSIVSMFQFIFNLLFNILQQILQPFIATYVPCMLCQGDLDTGYGSSEIIKARLLSALSILISTKTNVHKM